MSFLPQGIKAKFSILLGKLGFFKDSNKELNGAEI